MKVNLAKWDAWLRALAGFVLSLWAAAGGPWWAWIGVYLIFTSSYRFCLIYAFLNLRTVYDEQPEIRQKVD